MEPNNRRTRAVAYLGSLFDRIGYIWLWLALSLLLLASVAILNPILVASYAWAAAKLTMAAVIGHGVDLTMFRGADPRYLDGIEKSMAQTRRATLIAATMIAAGLIG